MDDFVVVSEVFVVVEVKKLLHAARDGQLDRLKRSAATVAEVLGGETQAIIRNMKDRDGRRAVHQAVAGGSVLVLKYLIEELKVEIDVRHGSGAPPLTHATVEGCVAAVEYLLELGANPELTDVSHSNPLHHAALRGHKDIVPLLLSKGMDVDVSNGKGSPLQFAAIAAKHDTVKVLLDHGANPNVVINGTFTPLYSSIHDQSWQCVEALLKEGADPNGGPDGIKALNLAAKMGVIPIIELLVKAGADPNVPKYAD